MVDDLAKKYFDDDALVADTFNYFFRIMGCTTFIDPKQLSKASTDLEISIHINRTVRTMNRIRDIARVWTRPDGTKQILVLGLELQSFIHYALPLKILTYDVFTHIAQAEKIAAPLKDPVKVEEGSDGKVKLQFTKDEFLSKFPKGAKLDDVLTLTVYLGEKPWDAPLTYFESLNLSEDAKKYKSDIKFYLIDPREIDEADFDGFETEVGNVYRILKYRDGKFNQLMENFVKTHKGMTVSEDGAELLHACGVDADIKKPEYIVKGGRVLMCDSMLAWVDRKNKEHDVSYIIRMMDELGWTETQAMDFCRIPEEDRPMYEALVEAERAKRANAAAAPVAS